MKNIWLHTNTRWQRPRSMLGEHQYLLILRKCPFFSCKKCNRRARISPRNSTNHFERTARLRPVCASDTSLCQPLNAQALLTHSKGPRERDAHRLQGYFASCLCERDDMISEASDVLCLATVCKQVLRSFCLERSIHKYWSSPANFAVSASAVPLQMAPRSIVSVLHHNAAGVPRPSSNSLLSYKIQFVRVSSN